MFVGSARSALHGVRSFFGLTAIAEDFSKVLVVTHLEAIKNAFPTRIEVYKDPSSGSHYQVLSE